jgi:hypothetical protein
MIEPERDRMSGPSLPSLSIVVVALGGGDATQQLLESLTSGHEPCEILVTTAPQGEFGTAIRWLETAADASVPARRSLGAAQAAGDVVAFLEDTVAPNSSWIAAVRSLHAAHANASAIGGTLQLDPGLPSGASALALLDAGRFVRRANTSEVSDALPGCNFSFKRSALEKLGTLAGEPLREAEAIPELLAASAEVRLESDMSALLVAGDASGQRLGSRFHHGRLYGGRRAGSPGLRALRALLAPLLPLVLLWRCHEIARREALPSLGSLWWHATPLAIAWSLGEAVGSLFGPGDAERHWR